MTMANLILSESLDLMAIKKQRWEKYNRALDGNTYAYVSVMYLLELLKACQCSLVSPAHAYFYARAQYNEPKTIDRDIWNKYLSQYRNEIETSVATHVIDHIAELSCAILGHRVTHRSIGLPKDIYDTILKCDKTFYGYVQSPVLESLELSLRHMDITEVDKAVREHIFTMDEVIEMFSSCLNEFVRPVLNADDLRNRTSPNALQYTTRILSIIYRLFSQCECSYIIKWDRLYGEGSLDASRENWVQTVPVRTPEAVVCLTGNELFSGKSIEAPVEIFDVVDRYLHTLR